MSNGKMIYAHTGAQFAATPLSPEGLRAEIGGRATPNECALTFQQLEEEVDLLTQAIELLANTLDPALRPLIQTPANVASEAVPVAPTSPITFRLRHLLGLLVSQRAIIRDLASRVDL